MATHCCAECGKEEEGGISLKTCKSCMQAKYCNAACQKKHWATHKKSCKQRTAEIRDEALFKDPPSTEDCPICFLPMPRRLICCVSLLPATVSSVPIYDFAIANEDLAAKETAHYYPCCGKCICGGCIHSFRESGNIGKCPFCNADRNKTGEERVQEIMKRAEANDPTSMCMLANSSHHGLNGLQQDQAKAMELYVRAADLGWGMAHFLLADVYHEGGNLKKAEFHYEAAAMAGNEVARNNIGAIEYNSGNIERAVKHWMIAASGGDSTAMHNLTTLFKDGAVSRESIDSTLVAYNNSCLEMRSEARDAYINKDLTKS